MARKNGKTALIAALVLVHLIGPEAGINEEIVSAANDREQAGMVFKYVVQIVAQSPFLTRELKVIASKKRVLWPANSGGNGSVYYALSAESGTKHGMNPTVVIYDELAQSKNQELFDALDTAQGAQEEPLFYTISTQSNDPQHPLSLMIDDGLEGGDESIVCHLYEVPEDADDIFDEDWWYSANPALDDFRSLDELRRYSDRAKRLPSLENTMRNLYLNQRVTQDATLFPRSVWSGCAGEVEFHEGENVYLALDLATTTDLAALAMLSESTGHLKVWFWKPEDLMEEHGKRDQRDYVTWHRQGLMEPCPGKTIDPDSIALKIAYIYEQYRIAGLAYDRWRIDTVIKALDRAHIVADTDDKAQIQVFPWGQGFRDMSPAVDAFEADVIDEKITHENHPVLNWNIANAIVTKDAAGNRKLDKNKSRMRIDGAVAATMVAGLRARHREEDRDSIYRTERLLIV